jgi:hypothetical protein
MLLTDRLLELENKDELVALPSEVPPGLDEWLANLHVEKGINIIETKLIATHPIEKIEILIYLYERKDYEHAA